ncbi:MAG: Flp/Fap pilin component [Hyphomicrobiales bacterium]|jgi:pilus assembly protein Flp/PilA|nr:Flp/Fap pilin component [Hyphomicrobiales bacterium]MEA2879812.1 Flp/Fap pilin component [Hyphomicrobiales bacterium]
MTNELLRSFGRLARRFRADESGATAIEYAMIAAGVGATIAAVVFNMGTQIKTTLWDKIGGAM